MPGLINVLTCNHVDRRSNVLKIIILTSYEKRIGPFGTFCSQYVAILLSRADFSIRDLQMMLHYRVYLFMVAWLHLMGPTVATVTPRLSIATFIILLCSEKSFTLHRLHGLLMSNKCYRFSFLLYL